MKITYYVGKIDRFLLHHPKATLAEADTKQFSDHHCFVYVDDDFVFSYPHDGMWLHHWNKQKRHFEGPKMRLMFERWIRLKLRQLQRTPPSA